MKKINNDYIKSYSVILNEIFKKGASKAYDESTMPSYMHNNKFIAWLFWKRIDTALSIAGDLKNKNVLDFGCGCGVIFKYLYERNCEITGCENKFYQLSKDIADKLKIQLTLYKRALSEITDIKFDYIFALDVLEHVQDLNEVIDNFLKLSHEKTEIIISGPTENVLYRIGRLLIGYHEQGRFHERNIFDIERRFSEKGLKNIITKNLYSPFTLFRVSSWRSNYDSCCYSLL